MARTRRFWSNFSKGELSPVIEGRPDVAAYFEGGRTIENWLLLRQGGLDRRPGTRFIAEVKDSAKDTILLPFEASVDDAFVIEIGNFYKRFYKNKVQVKASAGGPAVEIVSPYAEADIRFIHFTQSVDVMYLFNEIYAQRRLTRVSDISWALSAVTFKPPPSFENDTNISGGSATLTPGAVTGTGVTFTASQAVFLADGDKGRLIIFGASRAVITQVGPSAGSTGLQSVVTADILDDFPNTNPIPAGSWLLRLSPQTTLDPNIKEPVGAQVTLIAGTPTFRAADVGKFILIYDGLVKITVRDSETQVKGEILSILSEATVADPSAAPAGAWTLEVASWSANTGFPRTGEFVQGRLGQASTTKQRTTWWLSRPDDFESYPIGALADNAVEHTIASRQLNQIEWLAELDDIFIGTSGSEHRAAGGREGEPIGGDVIPSVRTIDRIGSAEIQQVTIGRRPFFIDRSRRKLYMLLFSFEEDRFGAVEVTGLAEHITGSGVRHGHIAVQNRIHPRLWFVREDGTLLTLTYFPQEKIVGFTRIVTDGTFEAVAAIPRPVGGNDQVYSIVKRTINGAVKRYVEVFDDDAAEFSARAWKSLQTDSAFVYDGVATTTITGLSHLEAKTVDVIADGAFIGTKVVTGGQIVLEDAAAKVEIGIHYNSTVETMRPAIENAVIEGIPRSWKKLWLRLKDTLGGTINGQAIAYAPVIGTPILFTGDKSVPQTGWDLDGRVKVVQDKPYPMTILSIFGTLDLGDQD